MIQYARPLFRMPLVKPFGLVTTILFGCHLVLVKLHLNGLKIYWLLIYSFHTLALWYPTLRNHRVVVEGDHLTHCEIIDMITAKLEAIAISNSTVVSTIDFLLIFITLS